ncbi:DMT family transporter [Chroococcidiopsis sp. CCMEE 29]|uniref:DMT family transporter n=1 Tax=Chroococcidiopsis sp. CCMEE 29 TaxID=155894 RepID=UPI0020222867|nr:DMT family transporter [Chroococcidiopsis sp. CCMEE 29]
MNKIVAFVSHLPNKIPAKVYLWLAVIIFATANSVTRKLTEIGSQNFIDGRNPISFCNVLFVGNICALLALILIYRQQLSVRSFRQFSLKDWGGMAAVALLSGALAPGVLFEALSRTTVNNVVLVGRIELPVTLALSIWLLGERVNRWEFAGAAVAFVGVAGTVVLQGLRENIMTPAGLSTAGWGEMLTAVGALALAISNVISKTRLDRIPIGIFTVVRTALGSVIFFFAALYLYGSNHFMDVFSPFLWKWMLVYGTIIVAVGQSFWLAGLKNSSGADASLAGAFNPIAAVLAAYLILGEVPTFAQYLGGGMILCGIGLSQIGIWRKSSAFAATQVRYSQSMDSKVGFKGL